MQLRRRPTRGPLRAALVALSAAVLVAAGALTAAATPGHPARAAALPSSAFTAQAHGGPDLGSHVLVFDPSMPVDEIQQAVDAVAARQVPNQFGDERDALLFMPGTYGSADHPLTFQVGYYTEVAGLGQNPGDVVINGAVDVANQCDANGCTALNNFWRSIANLTINVTGQTDCQAGTEFWAVSQAAPMRRVHVTGGNLSLMDYCSAGPQYASGGFIADSAVDGTTVNGSQQQFFVRGSSLGGWSNGVWNQVFSGVAGAPAQSFPDPTYTTLATTPISRERPYLYVDGAGSWRVFVPAARRDAAGTTWQAGPTAGTSRPIGDFALADPSTTSGSVAAVNAQLRRGKDLLLLPGVFHAASSIHVSRHDTVVLGLGLPSLTADGGAVPMVVDDVPGVDVAGLTFDAGSVTSTTLLRIGTSAGHGRTHGRSSEPTALQDVFFRIGGPHAGKARTSLVVNTDGTVLDDIWAWRADHGTGVGWTDNTAQTGVVVTGDDVTATGLFVEHYQQYNVIWRGERGRTVFFQNELPYDAPDQAAWQHRERGQVVDGWAAYKVDDSVRQHEAWGLGSYIYTNVNPTLHAAHGFEVPQRAGVRLHDLLTVSLNKAGTIDHVVNDVGTAVTPDVQGPATVVSYP